MELHDAHTGEPARSDQFLNFRFATRVEIKGSEMMVPHGFTLSIKLDNGS